FSAIADNWCPLVVDSSAERLMVQGFRFGLEQSADDEAWAIWQANGLDAQANMAHTEAIKLGESYWLVEPPPRGSSDPPRITAEHPSQVIVAHEPGDRRRRLAALKKWTDDDGFAYANLYLPQVTLKYRSQQKLAATGGRVSGRINWTTRTDDPGGENRLGEVPVIVLPNAPGMLRGGRSDLKSGIPIFDALNKLLSDMMIGSEYQAFPQRVLLGVEVPKDPVTGQPARAAELQASQSRLWTFSSPDAKVAEFNAADLNNYVVAREHLVRHLTAQTKMPPHYVSGQIVNAAAAALKAAETGLISKVRDKMPAFEEGHEDMMRLAFRALGNERRGSETQAELIWRDPESRSFGELIDGLVKLRTLGVPLEVLWERAGFSPQEIQRMTKLAGLPDRPDVDALPTFEPPGS
ncbi:MAG: phage portal protein, partial [Thermoleophilaceae bacterium]|nr:phage portal protein [Thermoleophilaceae bacterium]